MMIPSTAAGREIPVGLGATLPCCPTENRQSCTSNPNSWCIGPALDAQECDPSCQVSETITFGGDTATGAGATGAGVPSLGPYMDANGNIVDVSGKVLVQAQSGGGGGTQPTTRGPNWVVIAMIGVVVLSLIRRRSR
jgi:hypothetical protein